MIMKKNAILGVVLSTILLTACNSNPTRKDDDTKSEKISKSDTTKSTDTAKTKNQYQALVDEITAAFNTDGEKNVNVLEIPNIADETAPDGHTVIKIEIIDPESRKITMENQNAVDSGTATTEQRLAIKGLQLVVEDYAKKLNNDIDAIELINPDNANRNIVIAFSSKTKNIIPIILD
jgi:hypothetical protein